MVTSSCGSGLLWGLASLDGFWCVRGFTGWLCGSWRGQEVRTPPPPPPPAPPSVVLISSSVAHDVVDVTLTTQNSLIKRKCCWGLDDMTVIVRWHFWTGLKPCSHLIGHNYQQTKRERRLTVWNSWSIKWFLLVLLRDTWGSRAEAVWTGPRSPAHTHTHQHVINSCSVSPRMEL